MLNDDNNINSNGAKKGKHGGKRVGAGRKPNSGTYGEKTRPMRVPVSKIDSINKFLKENPIDSVLFYREMVSAGEPNYQENTSSYQLNLNTYLTNADEPSFYVRVSGDSMIDAHIFNDDIVAVCTKKTARHGDIVIAKINGADTLKRFVIDEKTALFGCRKQRNC